MIGIACSPVLALLMDCCDSGPTDNVRPAHIEGIERPVEHRQSHLDVRSIAWPCRPFHTFHKTGIYRTRQ